MTTLQQIVVFLDKELHVKDLQEGAINGLQVEGRQNIKKIAIAVDASLETFTKAQQNNSDMLIVHHGLFWGGVQPITGLLYKRLRFLIKNEMSLYAAHLPLDCHRSYGNNAQMAKLLGLKQIKPFGNYKGSIWGVQGTLKHELSFEQLMKLIKKKLASTPTSYTFGNKRVKKIGIVSGSGAFALSETAENNLDVLLTGEVLHHHYHEIKERKINVVSLGHYASERFGVLALAKLLQKRFNIETIFIDVRTGL